MEHHDERDLLAEDPANDEVAVPSKASSMVADKESLESKITSSKLHRFPGIVWLAFGYAILAIFPWVVTCISVSRPITAKHYGLWLPDEDLDGFQYPDPATYERGERWLHAARVIQAIVTVITIPLTSAVCSRAAVVFIQRKPRNAQITLRQTAVLADKGWTAYEISGHLLRGRWKRYGSTMLFLAIALNLLGSTISPLQSIFITTRSVQTPTKLGQVQRLTNINDVFADSGEGDLDSQLAVADLRSILTSTSSADGQYRLWNAEGAPNCSNTTLNNDAVCTFGQVSLVNMSRLQNPFLAQLPAGYNTGLVRQFLPRINSSVTRDRIPAADFPTDCDILPGSFYVNYSVAVLTGFLQGVEVGPVWSLIACMPADQRKTPWNDTRARQDFSEELYLNLSAWNPGNTDPNTPGQWSGYFKITANTTAGFFELPNYMNGNLPGPLLLDDPDNHCGRDCVLQGASLSPIYDRNASVADVGIRNAPEYNNSFTNAATMQLGAVSNRGPLLTIALALFGPDSFVADRVARPEAYIAEDDNSLLDNHCTDRVPFLGLLSTTVNSSMYTTDDFQGKLCVDDLNFNFGFLQTELLNYVQLFIYQSPDIDRLPSYDDRLQNGFEAAVFLANELFLTSATDATLTVNFDPGASIQVPHISKTGIILISTLLGLYLSFLLAMAMYSNTPHWTGQLDAFAMMRLGATIAEQLPFQVAVDTDGLKILDETPGWIGDATYGNGDIGELALGEGTPLTAERDYRCFEHEERTGRGRWHRVVRALVHRDSS